MTAEQAIASALEDASTVDCASTDDPPELGRWLMRTRPTRSATTRGVTTPTSLDDAENGRRSAPTLLPRHLTSVSRRCPKR